MSQRQTGVIIIHTFFCSQLGVCPAKHFLSDELSKVSQLDATIHSTWNRCVFSLFQFVQIDVDPLLLKRRKYDTLGLFFAEARFGDTTTLVLKSLVWVGAVRVKVQQLLLADNE